MIKKINFNFAINSSIIVICLLLIFHFLILFRIIPYELIWGGRLNSVAEMIRFEWISILMNIILGIIILIKGSFIKSKIPKNIPNFFLWIFTTLFVLNTIGNLFSLNSMESYIFTPVSLYLAIICYRLASEN